ncbi:DUF222 domain-containing protein [Friedmanniella luteola]|uniref:DUF222 domain-containing protein n=1 Tax=Friedmanniella luteola TaxID=546871 RepID=UPI0012FDB80C|nr:DUF222 domain-containing protein [Friedmanniella luteola]
MVAPVRPALAAAVWAGEVSAEKAAMITRALVAVDRPGFGPADVDAGEKLLTDDAEVFGPEDLRRLIQRVVDVIDPDGSWPDEELQHDRRWFPMSPTWSTTASASPRTSTDRTGPPVHPGCRGRCPDPEPRDEPGSPERAG